MSHSSLSGYLGLFFVPYSAWWPHASHACVAPHAPSEKLRKSTCHRRRAFLVSAPTDAASSDCGSLWQTSRICRRVSTRSPFYGISDVAGSLFWLGWHSHTPCTLVSPYPARWDCPHVYAASDFAIPEPPANRQSRKGYSEKAWTETQKWWETQDKGVVTTVIHIIHVNIVTANFSG